MLVHGHDRAPEAVGQIKEDQWYTIRNAFVARMAATACRGWAQAGPGKTDRLSSDLPRTPPDWIEKQLEADGKSRALASRLKAARAAEADAIEKLRLQLESLPLTEALKVGEAAGQDKQVAGAIDRALGRSRTKRVDYLGDGGAQVVMKRNTRFGENSQTPYANRQVSIPARSGGGFGGSSATTSRTTFASGSA